MNEEQLMAWSLLLLFFVHQGADGSRRFRTDFLQDLPTPGTGPSFDTSIPSNLTGLVGKTAYLNCRVRNLGNRTVSWVRHRDIHLLTVGRYTYTSDQRFEAVHSPHTEDWTLRIRYPQKKDTGIYECQISTTPPIGHPVFLNVVEPITNILGGPELFINKGSTINLTCLVEFAPEPPPIMLWSHNREHINFDSPRGGVSLVTEKGVVTTSRLLIQNAVHMDNGVYTCDPSNSIDLLVTLQPINFDSPRGGVSLVTEKGVVTTSRLLIQNAVHTDNGVYTCDPSNANSASIRVHILNGEHPAAMYHGASSPLRPPLLYALLSFSLLQMVI